MVGQKLVYIANVKEVPVGEAKSFLYPIDDEKGTAKPGLLIRLEEGFFAYDGLCTHLQAEVKWNKYTGKIWCTLHDGMYDPVTGKPFLGIPKEALAKVKLKIEENGDIYAIL